MSTVTDSDYFGSATSDEPRRHRHKHRPRHSKQSTHRDGPTDSDSSSPAEVTREEREYYDPVTNTRTREIDTGYVKRHRRRSRDGSLSSTSDSTAPHRHRRRSSRKS